MFCREHVTQLRDHQDEISRAGATIAAIGTGDLMYAEGFAEDRDVSFPLMVDPELETYRIAGTGKAGLRQLVGLSTVKSGLRALSRRQIQGRPGPHPLQLGATHVIRPDGTVPFAWVNDDPGDNAPVGTVLGALQE